MKKGGKNEERRKERQGKKKEKKKAQIKSIEIVREDKEKENLQIRKRKVNKKRSP